MERTGLKKNVIEIKGGDREKREDYCRRSGQ